jgi:crotonobetainyl-CoA:carnitine CoA-transferase CaiB-like acyl-CoA transferase
VIVRITGFGQDGPYANRPGFASIAEAMMGYASINGEIDGPPMIPPIALTDEVAGLVAAMATMVALHAGVGQVVDVNLVESMFQILGPLVGAWSKLGYVQPRAGSAIPYTVPRGVYTCADGRHVVVSASSDSVARRVMQLIGAGDDPRFATFASRVEHRVVCDQLLRDWIAARSTDEVVAAFETAEAAVSPVLTIPEMAADAHVVARGIVAELDGLPMQGLVARFSATPGQLRWVGRPLDADGDAVRTHGWGHPDD